MNMKLFTVVALVIAVIVGYFLYSINQGKFHKAMADRFGSSETCVDGVKYLQFPSGVTVKYNSNGSIATCN